jgi:hypothetical protein
MDWTAGVRFPAGARNFSLPHSVKISSGAHPALSAMGTGAPSLGESGRGVRLTTHFHIVPRSSMVELYLRSPIRLHGAVLNYLSTGTILPLPLWISRIFLSTLNTVHVNWVPRQHSMTSPQVANGRDGLQMWREAADIANSRQGLVLPLGGWAWDEKLLAVKNNFFTKCHEGPSVGKKLQNEDLHDLYSSTGLIRMIKSRRMR